jgi:phosphoglycerate dehydrogenase-like enzyme
MRVAILDDFQNAAKASADWSKVEKQAQITVFNDHVKGLDAVTERLRDFDIVVIMRERTPFPREQLERLPKLKLLATRGMVNRSIDLAAATERGIVVSGTNNVGTTTAELTWGHILSLVRSIPQEDRATREGKWQTSLGTGLAGKTLGVLGLGKVGSRVAKIGLAFGMKVIAWSQNLTEARCAEVGVEYAGSKQALLSNADVVTIHLALSDRTRGLIGKGELALMKPSAFLVNTSRGPIVDQAALIETLNAGRIAGAGIDVYDVEPLPPDHPMRRLPRSVLTPHLGYVSDENYRVFYSGCAENVAAFLAGKPLRVLNPDVLEKVRGPAAG